jgi:hypothetical protein
MKKIFKYALLFTTAWTMTFNLTSCSDDNDNSTTTSLSTGDKLLQEVLAADVDNTINPTYKDLADSSELLYNALATMKQGSITQSQVDAACKAFLGARSNYERSEAYLLGACSHFSIDPHIDSWPLDLTSLNTLLTSNASIASASNYDQSLIGFHGIEFILFRDGKNRDAEELNGKDSYNKDNINFTSVTGERELEFATAVAEDLKNSVFQLQCSWNEDAATARFSILDNLGKAYTTDLGYSYGKNLKQAGTTSVSTYSSVKNAAIAILNGDGGAAGIADEVGNVKIYNPYSGEDVSYIESPYSENSLNDFQNNIHSIENVWYGGVAGNRSNKSFHTYFAKYNSTVGNDVENAIDNALKQIAAIPAPFVKNYKNVQCKEAISACQALKKALDTAAQYIEKTNN